MITAKISQSKEESKKNKKNRGWFRRKNKSDVDTTTQATKEQKSCSPSPFAYSRSSGPLEYDDKTILDVEGRVQKQIAKLDSEKNAQSLRTAYGVLYFEGMEKDFPDDDSLQEVFNNELKNGGKKSTEFLNVRGRKYNRFESIRTKENDGKRFYEEDDEDMKNRAQTLDGNSLLTCLSASSLMSGIYGIMDIIGIGGNTAGEKETPVENIDITVRKSKSKRTK